MKKSILKVLLAVFAFIASSMSVMALEGDVTYVSKDKTVQINVQTELAEQLASVYIIPSRNVSEDNVITSVTKEDIESGNFFYKAVKSDVDGNIKLDVNISDAAGGKYQAFIFIGEAVFTDTTFLHTNTEEINTIIQESINPAKEAGEIAQIISEKCNTFGYDAEEIKQVGKDLGEIIYASRPEDGYSDSNEFETVYNKAMNIIEMRRAEKPSDYMEVNGVVFGIKPDDYKLLSQTVKDDFADRIMKSEFLSDDIDSIVMESLYLAILNSSSDYTSMKDGALLFAELADMDLANIIDVLDEYEKGLLFKDLYKSDYSSIEDFLAIVKQKAPQYSNMSGNSGNSNGGGGSGSSSGNKGGFSVPSNIPVTPQPVVKTEVYSDISGHWAEEIITKLSGKNIISGYTDKTFKPDNNITRAEFAKILVCMAGKELIERNVFADVESDAWYYKYVATANDMGIIMGNEGKFNPEGLITRQDAAVMIYRYVESVHGTLAGDENFKDINKASDYAVKSIKALAANGLISGSNGYFYPLKNTTRAEAAAFIYKLISFMKEA